LYGTLLYFCGKKYETLLYVHNIESQFTDYKQMVLSLDFGWKQFIIGLELWKDEINKERAYEDLLDYMDTKNAEKGYSFIFDFRTNKEQKTDWVQMENKKIFSVMV